MIAMNVILIVFSGLVWFGTSRSSGGFA
jgi:hypothetical protein